MGKKGFFVICMAVLCLLCAAALAADPEYWVLIRPGSEGSTEANFGRGIWFTSANGTIASSFVTAKDGQFFRDEDGNMHIKVSDYYSPEWITPADGYVFNGWEAVEGAERAEGEENDPSDFKLTAQSAIIQARWSKSWYECWITRENSANTCVITGANYDLNKVTEIFLPATINGLTVNRFDVSLEGLRDLGAVMIYKDFSIGRLPSFKNCKSLKNIHTVNHMGIISRKDTLPDSITEIGAGTFAGTKIMRLDMPNVERVVTGVSGAFESCNSLQSVTFGKAASIDSRAFSNISKTGIECTVTYPGTKANWSWDAFMYSPNLLVECNDGSCGWCGDQWTTGMEMYGGSCVHWTQDLNGNLTVDSFGSAEDLYENRKTAQIVRSHNAIPLNAKTLTIKHVYGIEDNAFRNQHELTKVSLPEDLTSIGSRAFFDCTALTSITLPGNVASIGTYAFANSPKLKDLYYEGTKEQWDKVYKAEYWNTEVSDDFQVHWRCGVSFDANGHGTAPSEQTNLWSGESKVSNPGNLSASGLVFTGWYTDQECTKPWDFSSVIPNDLTLYAGWSYTVSVSAVPPWAGTVSGGGTFHENSSVTVTAKANSGYRFLNWTENGTVVGTEPSLTFSATAKRELKANFKNVYTITVSANPAEGGSVTGGGTYDANAKAVVTAEPGEGYAFDNWTEKGNVVSEAASYTFTVSANRALVANFKAFFPGGGTENDPWRILRDYETVSLSSGWYEVSANVKIPERIIVTGDVNLELKEGMTLTVSKGIRVPEGSSLTISGKGTLNIPETDSGNAGIGGDKNQSCGTIAILDGTVRITAGAGAQAIGSGSGGTAGTLMLGDITVRPEETQDSPVAFEKREKTCRGTQVFIEPCGLHSYDEDPALIMRQCHWCAAVGKAIGRGSFILPEKLTVISGSSFAHLPMKSVYIPDGCTAIRAGAFSDCKNLTQVRIPDSVKLEDIAADAFPSESCLLLIGPKGGTAEQLVGTAHPEWKFAEE